MKTTRDTKATKGATKAKLDALPATISTRALEQLSGIGEKRLRQLATANKLPPAKDGRWETIPSIKGIVAHYRTAGAMDALDNARLAKLQAETAILELEHGELDGRLVDFDAALEVLCRGHGAMVSAIMAMTDLDIDKRETIINKIREAGEAFSSQFFGSQLKKESANETPQP